MSAPCNHAVGVSPAAASATVAPTVIITTKPPAGIVAKHRNVFVITPDNAATAPTVVMTKYCDVDVATPPIIARTAQPSGTVDKPQVTTTVVSCDDVAATPPAAVAVAPPTDTIDCPLLLDESHNFTVSVDHFAVATAASVGAMAKHCNTIVTTPQDAATVVAATVSALCNTCVAHLLLLLGS